MNETYETRGRYAGATFPWYGLDEAWDGRRWLASVCLSGEGDVEYGTLGHGEEPSGRPADPLPRRFIQVLTMPQRPSRPTGGGRGVLEQTTLMSAAAVAGVGLIQASWPWSLDRSLRQDWLNQQSDVAWDLAHHLDTKPWSTLALPIHGEPVSFQYRESEYGWVLVGEAPEMYVGAFGRGFSAYGIGFAIVELDAYADVR